MKRTMSRAQYIASILIIVRDVEESVEFREFKEQYGAPSKDIIYQSCMYVYDHPSNMSICLDDVHPYAKPVIERMKEVILHGD